MKLSSSHNFAFDFGRARTLNLVASLVIQWIWCPPQTTDFNMSKVYRLVEDCRQESDCDGEATPHGKDSPRHLRLCSRTPVLIVFVNADVYCNVELPY